tara:strand:+ start:237 stop:440 length:204 start_codon:yes stop_codon:yes gene_type:complete
MKYRGYYINLKPINVPYYAVNDVWQLELEKGSFITTRSVSAKKTLGEVEKYAYDQIDKLVEDEKKKT